MQHDIATPRVDCTKESGLLGYYFSDDSFTTLSYIAESHTGELAACLPEAVRSVYWCGYLRPDKSGEYHLSTGDGVHTRVTVNGRLVLGGPTGDAAIYLDAGTLNHLEVHCVRQPGQADVWLGCRTATSTETQRVSGVSLVLPNVEASALTSFGVPVYGAQERSDLTLMAGSTFSPADIDPLKKGIPDAWQISGFTVEYEPQNSRGTKKIVQWDEAKHQKKSIYPGGALYVKYTANPEVMSTVGDPYSDYDKVMSKCGDDVSPRVNHPWVAAWPEVTLEVAAFSIHEKDNKGNSTGRATAKYNSTKKTTGTITDSKHAVGLVISGGFEGKQPKGELSASYNYNWGTSKYDLTESESGSNASQDAGTSMSYDTSSKAATYASVRFTNVGTASIYKFEPTINMRLTPGEIGGKKYDYDDITTIATASNPSQGASDIAYGGVFPGADTTVMLYQLNDKNAAGIMLNEAQYQQFLALQHFDTTISSFTGDYMLKPGDYRHFVEYKNSINQRCVKVSWFIPASPNGGKGRYKGYNQQVVRYLYAKDNGLTIGKVLELTPELTIKDNKFTFNASRDMKGMTSTFYDLSVQITTRRDLSLSLDEYCAREVGSSITFDKLYQMKLTPELEITLSPKGYTSLNTGKKTLGFCYGVDANFVYGSQVITRPDIDGVGSKKTYRHLFDQEGKLNNQPGWGEFSTVVTDVKTIEKIAVYVSKTINRLYYNGYIDAADKSKGCRLHTGLMTASPPGGDNYYFNNEGMLLTGWLPREGKRGVRYGRVIYETKKQKQVNERGSVSYHEVIVEVMKPGESGSLGKKDVNEIERLKNNKLETYSYIFEPDEEGIPARVDGFKKTGGKLYYCRDESFDKDQRGWNPIPEDYPAGAVIKNIKSEVFGFRAGRDGYYASHDGQIILGDYFIDNTHYHFHKDTGVLLFYIISTYYITWTRGYDADDKIVSDKIMQDSNGSSYLFNSDGYCQLGWIGCPAKPEKWAYSNIWNRPYGQLREGWINYSGGDNQWYYFGTGSDNTGLSKFEMATGLIKIGTEYYYFTDSGLAAKADSQHTTKKIFNGGHQLQVVILNNKGLVEYGFYLNPVKLDTEGKVIYKTRYLNVSEFPKYTIL